MQILRYVFLPVVISLGCTPPSARENKNIAVSARTPAPPAPDAVETPSNVSFSTYSKEWPVMWQWIDPDEDVQATPHDTKKGVLRIRVPQGKDLSEDRANAPRYLKSLSGDFQIETRLRSSPSANYQGAGLLVFADPKTYLRFEYGYGGPMGSTKGLRLDIRTPEDGQRTTMSTEDAPIDVAEIELKLVKQGNEISAFFRTDENAEWKEVRRHILQLPPAVMAGIVACNTAREATIEFEYIHLLPVGR